MPSWQEKLIREAKERFLRDQQRAQSQRTAHAASSGFHANNAPRGAAPRNPGHPGNGGGGGGRSERKRSDGFTAASPLLDFEGARAHWRSEDPFVCLELGAGARSSVQDAKRAYRRLCLLYHPDKSRHPLAVEAFHAITRAYQRITGSS